MAQETSKNSLLPHLLRTPLGEGQDDTVSQSHVIDALKDFNPNIVDPQ